MRGWGDDEVEFGVPPFVVALFDVTRRSVVRLVRTVRRILPFGFVLIMRR